MLFVLNVFLYMFWIDILTTFNDAIVPSCLESPAKPNLTLSENNPTDGDDISLTCTSTSESTDSYEFLKGVKSLQDSPNSTYTIVAASIASDSGNYTCVAKIDTVKSEASSAKNIECEF